MKPSFGVLAALAIAITAAATSCAPPISPKPASEGKLAISLAASANKSLASPRTIVPAAAQYEIVLAPNTADPGYSSSANNGVASPYYDQLVSDVAAQISLPTGPWSLTVRAYDLSGALMKSGSTNFFLASGVNVVPVTLSLPLSGVGSASGTGSLAASYWWPPTTQSVLVGPLSIPKSRYVGVYTSGTLTPTYVTSGSFSLTTYPWDASTGRQFVTQDGTNTPTADGVTAGIACKVDPVSSMASLTAKSLASGSYWLSLSLYNGSAFEAEIGELVQIYNGTLSSKTEVLSGMDLIADLSITSAPATPTMKFKTTSDGMGTTAFGSIAVTESLIDPTIHFTRTRNGAADTGYMSNASTYDPVTGLLVMSQNWLWSAYTQPVSGDVFAISAGNRVGTSATASATYHPISLQTSFPTPGLPQGTITAAVAGSSTGVTWAIDNPSVASLTNTTSMSCTLTPISTGTVNITATALADPANTTTYSVIVPAVVITSAALINLNVSGSPFPTTSQASAVAFTGAPIAWSTGSGNNLIVGVDPVTGVVTANAIGPDTLIATSNGFSVSVPINVGP